MGYFMHQRDARFTIRASNVADAFGTLCEAVAETADTTDFAAAMARVGWEVETGEAGDVVGICFDGEKFRPSTETALAVIAPLVEAGSYIVMIGEDDDLWRWWFDGKQLRDQSALIGWLTPGAVVSPPNRVAD